MYKFRTRHVALLLSVAAIGAAGCGSSSSSKTTAKAPATPSTPATSSTPTTTAPAAATKSAFVAQVKPVCQSFSKALKAANPNDLNQLANVIDQYEPKFKAIQPPAALQATYAQLLGNFSKLATAVRQKDAATIHQLGATDKKLAAQLGLSHCGS